jgi:hypothetical protein
MTLQVLLVRIRIPCSYFLCLDRVSFPEEFTELPPSLQHLLRRILDKTPDTRITLDAISVPIASSHGCAVSSLMAE